MWSFHPVWIRLCSGNSKTQQCWCSDACKEQQGEHIHPNLRQREETKICQIRVSIYNKKHQRKAINLNFFLKIVIEMLHLLSTSVTTIIYFINKSLLIAVLNSSKQQVQVVLNATQTHTHLHNQLRWETACTRQDRNTAYPRLHQHTRGCSRHCSMSRFVLQEMQHGSALPMIKKTNKKNPQTSLCITSVRGWKGESFRPFAAGLWFFSEPTAGDGLIATIWAVNLPIAPLFRRQTCPLRTTYTFLTTLTCEEGQSGPLEGYHIWEGRLFYITLSLISFMNYVTSKTSQLSLTAVLFVRIVQAVV